MTIAYRRHVAIVCPAIGKPGGVAAVALRQAAGLARSFRITLISESYVAELVTRLEHIHISPPSFNWLRRYGHVPREIAFALFARRALAYLDQSEGLDFVLCHGHSIATLAAVPLQKTSKVPYGLVTHGDIFDRPKGTYDPLLTRFYKSVTRAAYRRASLVIALSPHMQALAERGGASRDRICVIANGIDPVEIGLTSTYTAPPSREPKLPLRILFVGRLSVEKGIDTLLHACRRLHERHVPFSLRIVGDGPMRGELRALVAKLALDNCTEFVGALPRNLLGNEYLECHVVCVPSRSEPFGIVALEAMAAGRPVIGTHVGGIQFAVAHEISGLLVSPDEPGVLANALEYAVRNPQELELMGRRGRDLCHKRFNWEIITQELAEAINARCGAHAAL